MNDFLKRQKRRLPFSIGTLMFIVALLAMIQLPQTLKTTGAILQSMSDELLNGLEGLDQMSNW